MDKARSRYVKHLHVLGRLIVGVREASNKRRRGGTGCELPTAWPSGSSPLRTRCRLHGPNERFLVSELRNSVLAEAAFFEVYANEYAKISS
jgi:hypothetical protein